MNINILEQKSTDWKPTVRERRLLEVLLSPEHRLKNVSEICSIAGCDRKIYYRAFQKPNFVAYYTAESKDLVKKSLGPIINACIAQAITGSASHTKIILTMAGEYAEHQRIDLNGKLDIDITDARQQLAERINAIAKRRGANGTG